jgi:uncharacterized iron-regulated protein
MVALAFWLMAIHAAKACAPAETPFLKELAAVASDCRHPLCGKIYPVASASADAEASSCPNEEAWRKFSSDAQGALSAGGTLLLGEVHDNPVHHRLQAAAVSEFATPGPSGTAVVFEQIRDDRQEGLDRFDEFSRNAARLPTVGDLKRFVEWDKSGWPKDIYDPLLESTISAKLAIYPGDASRPVMMKTAKEGEASVSEPDRKRLALDIPLGAELDAASIKEIEDSHCGAIPKSAFGGMAYAQRYRDAHLADAVLKASEKHAGVILIAGNGHVRTDRAVPWYIAQRAPGKKVVSVAFVEVEDGKTDAGSYEPSGLNGKPAVDYLIFTGRAERGDPCEKMRKK